MATLTVTTVDEDGAALSMVTPAGGGDVFDNTGRELLVVNNTSGGNIDITITATTTSFTSGSYGNAEKADRVLTVATSTTAVLGPFPRAAFNDSNEQVEVVSDTTVNVEYGVLKYV